MGRFGRARARRDAAHALYMALVKQARDPVFFADWGVPDTREGRLEMVSLHAILLMRRLKAAGEEGQAAARELLELYLADLDRHMREWGVGDLSVGKHMHKVAESFFARVAAVDPLLATGDAAALEPIVRRNVYTEVAAADPALVARMARYLVDQDAWLGRQPGADLVAGAVTFARPAADG